MTNDLHWHTMNQRPPEYSAGAFLLIHGWLGSLLDWRGVARELPAGCHLAAVDLPGHGGTPEWPDEQLTFSTVCEALATITRTAFATVRPVVVGYSLGGRIALQLAQATPELLSGVVLIAAHPGLPTEALRAARCASDADRAAELTQLSFEPFLRHWYSRPPFSSLREKPHLREAIIQRRLSAPPRAPNSLLKALSLGRQPPPPPSLPLPTLLIAGADDPTYCAIITKFAEQVAALSVIIPDAGHALLHEAPASVAAALIDFFRQQT